MSDEQGRRRREGLQFGLLYFSTGDDSRSPDKYRLVIEGARFADQHGFGAIWLPERHFGAVGALYPNPAVLQAAVARETKQIDLRAGSVVLPLHHPLRVAEEWSVVDNLSNGRVGVAFASGWHPDDFAFFPDKYATRADVMFQDIEVVQKLWRGESMRVRVGDGRETDVRIHPKPVQPTLPFWITAAGNPKTYARAGAIGANLLTHMFNQPIEDVAARIAVYRASRAEHGHDPASGRVSMMLHTFVHEDPALVREQVRGPFARYVRQSEDLLRGIATSKGQDVDFSRLSDADKDGFVQFVLDRFLGNRVLFGTPDQCFDFVRRLWDIGVDEIACQLDFGVDEDTVLASLPALDTLRARCERELRTRSRATEPVPARPRAVAAVTTPETLTDIRARCTVELGGDDFYARLAAHGMAYTGAFRAVQRVWRRDGEALGEVRLPEAVDSARGPYRVHPALLDACFQVMTAAVPGVGEASDAVYMPAGLSRFRTVAQLGARVWSHVVMRAPGATAKTLEADIRLLDDHGVLVAEAAGLRVQRVDALAADPEPPHLFRWRCDVAWVRDARATGSPSSRPAGRWLLVGEGAGLSDAMTALLRSRGDTVVQTDSHAGSIARALDAQGRPTRVVHLTALDGVDAVAPRDAARVTAEALRTVQALVAHGIAAPTWFVTRGAQAVRAGEGVDSLGGAALWGFARAVGNEHSSLRGGLVDLDPGSSHPACVAQLLDAVDDPRGEDQLAYRDGVRHLARLRNAPVQPTVPALPALRGDGVYLVPGGLGGIGLEIARWLVARGARQLVLYGRRGLPARATWPTLDATTVEGTAVRAVLALEASGARVRIDALDAADEAGTKALLASLLADGWGPVRGVVHSAGVWDDRSIQQMDTASLDRVLGPKAHGAWVLHTLLDDAPLDFFVLCSSVASLLGSPGQANYAAANAFLDGLAHQRRAAGRPALTVNWGVWSGVGDAVRKGQLEPLARQGVGSITPRQGIELLGHAMATAATTVAVLPIDWHRWREVHPDATPTPFLADIAGASAVVPVRVVAIGAGLDRATLLALPVEAREARLVREVREHVARAFRIPAARIDVEGSLLEVGLDSLLAVELKNQLELALGVALPIVAFLEGPSIVTLARQIVRALPRDGVPGASTAPMTTVPRDGPLPISSGQERLWFLQQFEPASTAYNIGVAVSIRGPLRPDAVARALTTVVARQESLRTRFPSAGGRPYPQLDPSTPFALRVEDLVAVPDASAEATRRATALASQPFDLAQGPLLRAALYRTADDAWLLTLCVHHIVSDGWSMGLLVEELGRSYEADATGTDAALRPLPIQYLDFAAWQRTRTEAIAADTAWWRTQLQGAPALLELPTDRARPPVQTLRGAVLSVDLPDRLVDALRALAVAEASTLFNVCFATFSVLLARHAGQDDLVIGTPVAGRDRAELEPLVGFFVQTLALRVRLADDPTFRALLARTRETALAAFAHQGVPFEQVVDAVQPPRNVSHTPLFQTLFVQNKAVPPLQVSGLELATRTLDNGTSKFDLSLLTSESPAGFQTLWEYNTDLFDADSIARMAARYVSLLEDVVARPAARVSTLRLLPATELHAVTAEWNDAPPAGTTEGVVHAMFEAQAARTPDAVAVVFDGDSLTYRALDRRANQLAHHLRRHGVERESLVAVHVARSLETVVVLLGVLKAGAAYVPLDPTYPVDRLAYMARDAGARVVVTDVPGAARIAADGAHVLDLTAVRDALDREPVDPPAVRVHPQQLAYLIYTSGSTGRPKGVMVQHDAVANLLLAMRDRPGLDATDVLLAVTSLSFDIAALELFLPLIVGARLVVAGRSVAADGVRLLDCIANEGVTTLQATPATWRLLLDAGWSSATPLRALCGGEALPPSLATALHGNAREAWNVYGPTETTIWSTAYELDGATVSLGRPIAGTRVYVLDAKGHPSPIGVPGELYLAGAGVTRGYRARAGETAARFVPDAFSQAPGRRMYRTGDLVRRRPDGALEYVRRVDHQVKLRGYRVEPGEVESVLSQVPGVRSAVAVVHGQPVEDARLVAYVTLDAEAPASTVDTLRARARRELPEYMVPGTVVVLDALPLTPNGKVDRAALPAPDQASASRSRAYVAPRDETETRLAGIWSAVLGVARVGVDDNFFELGGHSLRVAQVTAQVREAFGVDVPLSRLFASPTVATLATEIARASAAPVIRAQAAPDAALLDRVDQMGDDEVDALMRELEDDGDAPA